MYFKTPWTENPHTIVYKREENSSFDEGRKELSRSHFIDL
jgi:hypothetical protein